MVPRNLTMRSTARRPFTMPLTWSGKRALVTGGAGFIGSHIVDHLVAAGCDEVVVLESMTAGRMENLHAAIRSGRVRIVVGDIRSEMLLREAVQGVDIVFHQVDVGLSQCAIDPRGALEVLVHATLNLFERCVASGVRKIVMGSSALAHDALQPIPGLEPNARYTNRTVYGAAKRLTEALLQACNDMHGIQYAALRYFDVYGPRMDSHGPYPVLLLDWTQRLAAGLPPIIVGDARQTMDLVSVEDVARANLLAAVSPTSDLVLSIASGHQTSLLEIARQLCIAMERRDIEPIFWEDLSHSQLERRLTSTTPALQVIAFKAAVPLAAGLADLVYWWRRRFDSH